MPNNVKAAVVKIDTDGIKKVFVAGVLVDSYGEEGNRKFCDEINDALAPLLSQTRQEGRAEMRERAAKVCFEISKKANKIAKSLPPLQVGRAERFDHRAIGAGDCWRAICSLPTESGKCQHDKGMTEFCEPCGRIHSS